MTQQKSALLKSATKKFSVSCHLTSENTTNPFYRISLKESYTNKTTIECQNKLLK